ncbi:MAG: 5'/3'-nucleotidase SurE, partial [Candidatus Omnitrophica bacterium]|nr:5'/3'-nucleotidase SurE [Candidatus Omnitrophota bacterium]
PDSEKSSISHAITLSHPIGYKKIYRNKDFFGYGVNGTPADCVKLAFDVLLQKKPDVVVSGINLGCNDGCSVFYSGTVAGAREAALMGIPAIAVSLNAFQEPVFEPAAKYTANLLKQLSDLKMPKGTFLNVNVPNTKIKGIKFVRQCTIPIHGTFKKTYNPTGKAYYWLTGKKPKHRKNTEFDTYALNSDYVTVVPIKSDVTDDTFLEQLQNLDS